MTTINGVKSLAMLKMEKNFVAVIEKGYDRCPYNEYDLIDAEEWLKREVGELIYAIQNESTVDIRNEIADVSNVLDYMYEMALREEDLEEEYEVRIE